MEIYICYTIEYFINLHCDLMGRIILWYEINDVKRIIKLKKN